MAVKVKQPTGTLQSILNNYQRSPRFTDLAPRTRKDYAKLIRLIETEFGDFPLDALSDRRTRGTFLEWRDKLAFKSRRQADYTFCTFAAILAWATVRGLIASNPCERPGKLYRANRADSVWMEADEKAFLDSAPDRLRLAYLPAVWTGQRQGDLLRLAWSAYDGASWRKAVIKAKVTGLTFHDLRGTAMTRLALAGCNESKIATITGHSIRDVGSIMDTHYLSRDSRLAESAVRKREAHEAGTKIPK